MGPIQCEKVSPALGTFLIIFSVRLKFFEKISRNLKFFYLFSKYTTFKLSQRSSHRSNGSFSDEYYFSHDLRSQYADRTCLADGLRIIGSQQQSTCDKLRRVQTSWYSWPSTTQAPTQVKSLTHCSERLSNIISSQLGGAPVVAYFDQKNDVVRLLEQSKGQPINFADMAQQSFYDRGQTQNSSPVTDAQPRQLRAFGKKSKVPRPPNAFIIYRAQFHPHMKQHNPQMHNNEISKALGERWKNEPENVKEKYRRMALEVKAKHAAQHPNYQYAPRKPGEKKRRMTARKLERLRQSQGAQETSNFPSPDTIVSDSFDTNTDPESPDQAITYQEDDTFMAVLPTSFDDIQDEISRECGVYNEDYYDVAADVDDSGSSPENHLLQASPTSHTYALQNSWESLIDWHGLNNVINSVEAMAVDSEDITAAQASGPDSKHVSQN